MIWVFNKIFVFTRKKKKMVSLGIFFYVLVDVEVIKNKIAILKKGFGVRRVVSVFYDVFVLIFYDVFVLIFRF